VLSPKCLDYIAGDASSWESESLAKMASDGQLMAYKHLGFWQAMDTLRDKNLLEELWQTGKAKWKAWE
jgi:glucose-1-phosphate cytidylyltransferase